MDVDAFLASALVPILEETDYSESLCAACETGGDLICCDGRCLRSFHPRCIGLKVDDIPEDRPFVCSDCWNGVQRCFCCKKFEVESEMIKCSLDFCGKFYHEKCIQIKDVGPFICKLHICDGCPNKQYTTNTKGLWRCFRCPVAFDLRHRPKDVHILVEGIFLCINHVQSEDQDLPDISNEVKFKLRKQQSARLPKKVLNTSNNKENSRKLIVPNTVVENKLQSHINSSSNLPPDNNDHKEQLVKRYAIHGIEHKLEPMKLPNYKVEDDDDVAARANDRRLQWELDAGIKELLSTSTTSNLLVIPKKRRIDEDEDKVENKPTSAVPAVQNTSTTTTTTTPNELTLTKLQQHNKMRKQQFKQWKQLTSNSYPLQQAPSDSVSHPSNGPPFTDPAHVAFTPWTNPVILHDKGEMSDIRHADTSLSLSRTSTLLNELAVVRPPMSRTSSLLSRLYSPFINDVIPFNHTPTTTQSTSRYMNNYDEPDVNFTSYENDQYESNYSDYQTSEPPSLSRTEMLLASSTTTLRARNHLEIDNSRRINFDNSGFLSDRNSEPNSYSRTEALLHSLNHSNVNNSITNHQLPSRTELLLRETRNDSYEDKWGNSLIETRNNNSRREGNNLFFSAENKASWQKTTSRDYSSLHNHTYNLLTEEIQPTEISNQPDNLNFNINKNGVPTSFNNNMNGRRIQPVSGSSTRNYISTTTDNNNTTTTRLPINRDCQSKRNCGEIQSSGAGSDDTAADNSDVNVLDLFSQLQKSGLLS